MKTRRKQKQAGRNAVTVTSRSRTLVWECRTCRQQWRVRFRLLQYQNTVVEGTHNFSLRFILKRLKSSSFFFFFFFFVAEWVTDNCALLNEKERERIFALDSFFWGGVWSQYHGVFEKDWICNKIEYCDVGMVFHSTLESGCHLGKKQMNTLVYYSDSLQPIWNESNIYFNGS